MKVNTIEERMSILKSDHQIISLIMENESRDGTSKLNLRKIKCHVYLPLISFTFDLSNSLLLLELIEFL